MPLREWSGIHIGLAAGFWALTFTTIFWGPTLHEAWRSGAGAEPVFVVAHPGTWVLYLGLLIGPPVMLTLAWRRHRAM